MTNPPKTDDRDLDLWCDQWSRVVEPSPDFRRQVLAKVRIQDRRFWIGNLLTAAVFVGALIFAVFQFSHAANRLEKGQAIGVCVLLFVSVACRLWLMRGTWRAETRSIRPFVELWQRRVRAQIRALEAGLGVAVGWLIFCAALAAANWATVGPEVVAHPAAYLFLMGVIGIMLPVIWFAAMWFRRRKLAELNEVTNLLEEIGH